MSSLSLAEPRGKRRSSQLDDLHADAIGVSGKRFDVGSISGDDRDSWFGDRDDGCIDG
jgi:hypothetical protein